MLHLASYIAIKTQDKAGDKALRRLKNKTVMFLKILSSRPIIYETLFAGSGAIYFGSERLSVIWRADS